MIAVYPGTFDPITYGHIDIIERVSRLSKQLIVAILDNVNKKSLFSIDERLAHIQAATGHLRNVDVISFFGLQVDLAKETGATVLIRGLRSAHDLDHELIMAMGNRCMSPRVETLFIPSSPQYSFVSSSLVKEIAAFGGNLEGMIPSFIHEALKTKNNNVHIDRDR